jgi:hypothetical protein
VLLCPPPILACAAAPLHCSYEDNFDAVNFVSILSQPTDKGSIDGYGAPEKFLESVQYLFGKQTFAGACVFVVCVCLL